MCDKIRPFFFVEEGGKSVLNKERVKYILSSLVGITTLFQVFAPSDDSILGKSYKPFEGQKITEDKKEKFFLSKWISNDEETKVNGVKKKTLSINYRAKQVIERSEVENFSKVPSGSSFVGKLLTSIDSRENNQFLKVSLPYGGGSLPKNSILWGAASFGGERRIYLRFNKVIIPTGQEFKIDAIALSSSDYSVGLLGNKNSQVDLRLAGSLGMTLISSATDVLTDRTNDMNIYGPSVSKIDRNTKNALLQGASEVARAEAERHTEQMQDSEEYLTLDSGSDLIVSLLTPFKGESTDE